MAINFIPGDPLSSDAAGSTLISIAPTPDRPAGSSGIVVDDLPNEANYPAGSPEFIAWQAREAVLRAIKAFEDAYGPIPGWRGEENARTLALIPIAGDELNAYYDRGSISTFRYDVGGTTVYSGAGMKVVAHETGHAILDAIRPDLFGVNMIEVGAFHEGFGDCVAVHTAIADVSIRNALLAQGTELRRVNFVESLAEQLADAIRIVVGPKNNAAAPRHAFNAFQWAFPTSLPINGPPGTLINEEHSLGQVISGIFYELICRLFAAGPQTEAGLKAASDTAMMLSARAAVQAPIKPRFFESWGRSMAVLDRQSLDGANQNAITAAFSAHGIAVGAANFLAPRMRLSGAGKEPSLATLASPANKRLVRQALGITASLPLATRSIAFGDNPLAELMGRRDVDLSGIDPRLEDVHSSVPQPAIIGAIDGSTALLGAVDSGFAYDAEVRAFAQSLIAHDAIAFGRTTRARKGPAFLNGQGAETHRVASEGGQRILKRIAFKCGCRRS